MYALVEDDGTIHVPYRVPNVLRTPTGDIDLRPMEPGLLAEHGIVEAIRTDRPDDTDTHTHDASWAFTDGAARQVWTQREWTADELAGRQAQANAGIIDAAISAALAELDTLIAAPAMPVVPAGTFSTAQLSNYLRALRDEAQATRAGAQRVAATLKATIRLVRGDFDAVE